MSVSKDEILGKVEEKLEYIDEFKNQCNNNFDAIKKINVFLNSLEPQKRLDELDKDISKVNEYLNNIDPGIRLDEIESNVDDIKREVKELKTGYEILNNDLQQVKQSLIFSKMRKQFPIEDSAKEAYKMFGSLYKP